MPETSFKGSALAKALSENAVAHRAPRNPAAIEAARSNLAAAKIANYIEKVVAQAPPFTPEQVNQLRVLLEPARGGGDHVA